MKEYPPTLFRLPDLKAAKTSSNADDACPNPAGQRLDESEPTASGLKTPGSETAAPLRQTTEQQTGSQVGNAPLSAAPGHHATEHHATEHHATDHHATNYPAGNYQSGVEHEFAPVASLVDPNGDRETYGKFGQADDELAIGSTSQTHPVHRHDTPAANKAIDPTPAGRGWMELMYANRKTVGLIAIVVAVAFWTSRGSNDSPNPSTEASSSLGDNMASFGSPAGTLEGIHTNPDRGSQSGGSTTVNSATVDLGQPRIDASDNLAYIDQIIKPVDSATPATPDFAQLSTQAQPAAASVGFSSVDLSSSVDATADADNVAESPPLFRQSRTPNGVADWSSLLPTVR